MTTTLPASTVSHVDVTYLDGEAYEIGVRHHRVRVDQTERDGGTDQAATPSERVVGLLAPSHTSNTSTIAAIPTSTASATTACEWTDLGATEAPTRQRPRPTCSSAHSRPATRSTPAATSRATDSTTKDCTCTTTSRWP